MNRTAAGFDVAGFSDWLGQVTGEPAEVTVAPMSGGGSSREVRGAGRGVSWRRIRRLR